MKKSGLNADQLESKFFEDWAEQALEQSTKDSYCALRGQAYLESMINALVEGFLVETTGLPPTFSAMCRLAKCLGLIPNDAWHNLTILGDIRNEFAHHLDEITFDHPNLSDHFNKLTIKASETATKRERFINACALLMQRMAILGEREKLKTPPPWHPKKD